MNAEPTPVAMNQSFRSSGFSPDFFAAELAAYPLTSQSSLNLGLTWLDPRLEDKETVKLWRGAERDLLVNRTSVSLDEAALIRDFVWFDTSQFGLARIPMHQYLMHLADRLFEIDGGYAVPRIPVSSVYRPDASVDRAAGRALWMWFQIAMPEDVLVAAAEVFHEVAPLQVRAVSPGLSQMLRLEGFVETHVHLGAAVEFELIWISSLILTSIDSTSPDVFKSPGAELDEGRQLFSWLAAASLCRLIIADFLFRPNSQRPPFDQFLNGRLADMTDPSASHLVASVIRGVIGQGKPLSAIAAESVRQALRSMLPPAARSKHTVSNSEKDDPISEFVRRATAGQASPERMLLRAGLDYCRKNDDPLFARLFWQMIRIRGIYYRHLVMRPMSRGLQQFVRFFGRLSPGKTKIHPKAMFQSALTMAGRGHGLLSVELRETPADNLRDMRARFKQYQEATTEPDAPAISLIFHFNRRRGGRWHTGEVAAAEACSRVSRQGQHFDGYGIWRHQQFYRGVVTQAQNLAKCVAIDPGLLNIWRGLDCCTDEQGVPAWVLQPIFRWLRRRVGEISRRLEPQPGRKALHATVHAGEDFIHLLSGLRIIDESVRAFALSEGDRIGHGLALGLEPIRWCKSAGRIAMAREQRLFDLIWALRFVDGHHIIGTWQREAIGLMRAIFGLQAGSNPLELAFEFYDALFHIESYTNAVPDYTHPVVASLQFPAVTPQPSDRLKRLLNDYLHSFAVHLRSREVCWVVPGREADAIAAIQQKLRARIARHGMVIEVNPTSNLLIADLGELHDHPLWRMRSPIHNKPDDLTVIVGTDDPLILASNLPTEYQRLSDAMAEIGLSDEIRNRWLLSTIRAGLVARFT